MGWSSGVLPPTTSLPGLIPDGKWYGWRKDCLLHLLLWNPQSFGHTGAGKMEHSPSLPGLVCPSRSKSVIFIAHP